jgi:hypothetical protein
VLYRSVYIDGLKEFLVILRAPEKSEDDSVAQKGDLNFFSESGLFEFEFKSHSKSLNFVAYAHLRSFMFFLQFR